MRPVSPGRRCVASSGSSDPGGITCARPAPATVQLPPGRPMTSVCSSRPIQRSGVPSSTARRHSATRPGAKWGITAVPGQEPEPGDAAAGRPQALAERHRPGARAGEARRPGSAPRGWPPTPACRGSTDGIRSGSPPGKWMRCATSSVSTCSGSSASSRVGCARSRGGPPIPGPRRGGTNARSPCPRRARAAGARPRSGRWHDRIEVAGRHAGPRQAARPSPPRRRRRTRRHRGGRSGPWRAAGLVLAGLGHAGPVGLVVDDLALDVARGLVDPGCGARRDVDHHPGRRPAPDEHPGQPLRPGDERREEREHEDRQHQPHTGSRRTTKIPIV